MCGGSGDSGWLGYIASAHTQWLDLQVKTALEFAQRIKEFTSLMFYGGLAGHTSNWAKYPLVLASRHPDLLMQ